MEDWEEFLNRSTFADGNYHAIETKFKQQISRKFKD